MTPYSDSIPTSPLSESDQSEQILQLGHPLLKKRAQPVSIPVEAQTLTLIDQLMQLLRQDHGVGIAAPQIGRSQQVIIIASRPNLRYPKAPKMEPLPMINPQIVSYSSNRDQGWEGCLSIPGIRGNIERSQSVEVKYYDCHSQAHQNTFHGFVARIIQHECDHLKGKVFLDHVQSSHQLLSEQEYYRQIV